MRTVTDAERRARLGRRHALASRHRVPDVEAATRAMVVLHATEAPSVHLAAAARVDSLTVADVDRALFQTRTLVKQLAMRRTLFAFPRDLLAAAVRSCGARVAAAEHGRLVKDMVAGALSPTVAAAERRLIDAERAVLTRLATGAELTTREIGAQVPETAGRVLASAGTAWESSDPLAPRVLTLLGARGRIVRGPNELHWRQPRYRWAATEAWLGEPLVPTTPEEGWAELVRRYLRAFVPATESDVVWWLGSTKIAVRRALADVHTVAVELEDGGTAYLLADDLDEEPPIEPWAALLPTLDPTTMGWKARDFYLDPTDVPYLFDRAGNAGPTAWWDGRIVGTWIQDEAAQVHVIARGSLPSAAQRGLQHEAARLTEWFGGERVTSVYAARLAAGAKLQ
jgi:hypothetical protein